jgi:hypothetical protein
VFLGLAILFFYLLGEEPRPRVKAIRLKKE